MAKVKPPSTTEDFARTLIEVFLSFDTNGDQKLSYDEFLAFLKAINIDEWSAPLAFAIFDADRSGFLDFGEFLDFVIYQGLAATNPREYFKRAFVAFDVDKSGKLDAAELGRFLTVTGVQNADELATATVAGCQGALTFEQLAYVLDLPAE
jgi:Ca2+-binding EF-hand superfamily protein